MIYRSIVHGFEVVEAKASEPPNYFECVTSMAVGCTCGACINLSGRRLRRLRVLDFAGASGPRPDLEACSSMAVGRLGVCRPFLGGKNGAIELTYGIVATIVLTLTEGTRCARGLAAHTGVGRLSPHPPCVRSALCMNAVGRCSSLFLCLSCGLVPAD